MRLHYDILSVHAVSLVKANTWSDATENTLRTDIIICNNGIWAIVELCLYLSVFCVNEVYVCMYVCMYVCK